MIQSLNKQKDKLHGWTIEDLITIRLPPMKYLTTYSTTDLKNIKSKLIAQRDEALQSFTSLNASSSSLTDILSKVNRQITFVNAVIETREHDLLTDINTILKL